MLSRTISFLACLAVLGSALFVAGCAKPASTTTCSSGQLECGSTCANVQTDNQNCGACGTVCQSGQSCQAGKCSCSSGMLCGSSCVTSDANNCGSCGKVCTSGQVCNNNQCSSSCSSGQTQCGTACTTTATDANNCGSCGTVCPAGATCSGGSCGCSGGEKLCGSTCVNTNADNSNCGSCGTVCSGGKNCSNGACVGGGSTGGSSGTGTGGSGTGTGGTGTGTGGSGTGTGGSGTGTGGTGTGTGGATGTGGTSSAGDPPGYYKTADWKVSSVDWHGCVWTGVDSTVSGSTTSIMPQDFTGQTTEGGPYEVKGTVFNDYNAVALLGFNLNEATTGSSTQCQYNKAAATSSGPPIATIPSSATGIAVNWSETKAPPTSFRIQIQDVDGATNAAHRWCATITDAAGPSFIKFTDFYPQCWNVGNATMSPGTAFSPTSNTIDAVVFLVPGSITPTTGAPFDFTIVGFAPGTKASDAPAGGTSTCGMLSGTIGSTTAGQAASFDRKAVTGTDCKTYIVQNNNWGNPTGSAQQLSYSGTGFTVMSSSGSGSSAPASFPSTYVGANGNIANGTYNTWSNTGLPKQISAIGSAKTSFGWSGGGGGKQFNATYDVWFAKSDPTSEAGMYNDGISGFIMVWLYKPSNFHPIGNSIRTATIVDSAGTNHTFDVWVGPRGAGQGSTGGVNDGSGRPVISYVSQSTLTSLTFDLKLFMSDAVSHGSSDMSGGASGISQAFASSWYLTDVFAGFEIWTGSDAANLKSTGFSFALQ